MFTGKIVRAIPRPASCAILFASTFVSLALVATTASVVWLIVWPPRAPFFICASLSANSRLFSDTRAPATIFPVAGSCTSPSALTATRLDTRTPPGSATVYDPRPAFIARFIPNSLPTVPPVPAPAQPSFTASVLAAEAAASPIATEGHTSARPIPRS